MLFSVSRATPPSPTNDTGSFQVVRSASKGLMLAVCFSAFAGLSPDVLTQENAPQQSTGITLNLPPDVASETVQINYFMLGLFGGYGGFVTREKGRVSYDIPASVDGKLAEKVKIIAYIPGCEIAKLEITMQAGSEARTIPCKALRQVPLHGRILPVSVAQTPSIEVEITYQADWDHEFFGIADGMITSFQVATVSPEEDGRFEVELPDFLSQAGLGKGSFQFMLRNKSSRNIIAILKPGTMPRFVGGLLPICSSYEPFVLFSADTPVSTLPSTNSGPVEDGRDN
jgi:hypothetical protein